MIIIIVQNNELKHFLLKCWTQVGFIGPGESLEEIVIYLKLSGYRYQVKSTCIKMFALKTSD